MPSRTPRFSFLVKIAVAALLIAAADALFQDFRIGSWLGGLALAWVLVLLLVRPAVRRGPALVASLAAIAFALVLADDPGLLGWVLFWTALSLAALLPRTAGFDDAWRWAVRLAMHALTGPLSPLFDLPRLFRSRPRHGRLGARGLVAMLALPIAGSALFAGLFASANPLIAQVFGDISLPAPSEVVFWLFVLAIVWPSLRPRALATRMAGAIPDPEITLPGASVPSVLISLAAFNILFAVQNILDGIFLWSGGALPAGMTQTEYVHRGAYPLIMTALLAGVFVLATLKPGSATAANPTIRRLMVLWVAQNLILVASSVLRTCDYVAASGMTPWRIAALAWMTLVALGLVLICWRMLTARSARWLINTNALAALVVLTAGSIIDLDAVAAEWNVQHAREAGGRGVPLDLCELHRMGSSALVPFIELERQRLDPAVRDRVRAVRQEVLGTDTDGGPSLETEQADWRTWTWRSARRLARAHAMLGDRPPQPASLPEGAYRACDGSIQLPSAPPLPLTAVQRP